MFFDQLQQLCKQKGISMTKLVTDIGMSKSAVTYWKNTDTTPKTEVLQKIADYLDTPISYFFDEETKKSPAEAEDKITFDDFTYAMYNHSADLTEEEKKMLLEMAEFMKKKRGL